MIPLADLQAQHAPLRSEILAAVEQVLDSGAFSGGRFVQRFEEEFAGFCGTRHCVGVASGTHALWLALLALEVGPGDEVITVPNTFFATVEAIMVCGAKPVFVDVDERSFTMDPNLLERAIGPRTKAIIPVHLYGQMADMDRILEIAQRHGIPVIEDAAQAHGAEFKGRRAGSTGVIGCFSFYPAKNLGAIGEAGACVTSDASLRDRLAMLRDHGQPQKYFHSVVGWNARMDGIQGAVLSVKLRHLEDWNEVRRAHAAAYGAAFSKLPGILAPTECENRRHVFHLYVLRTKARERMRDSLERRGISSGIHYPVPLHLQQALAGQGWSAGDFPVSERCAREVISLPVFPELSEGQRNAVIAAVESFAREGVEAAANLRAA